MILLVLMGYGFLAVYEFIPIYKQKQWTELWVNGMLAALSFTIAVLLSLDIKIPSPAKPIGNFITSIFGR